MQGEDTEHLQTNAFCHTLLSSSVYETETSQVPMIKSEAAV